MNNKWKSLITDDDRKNAMKALYAMAEAWGKLIREKYGDHPLGSDDEDEEFIKYLEEEET